MLWNNEWLSSAPYQLLPQLLLCRERPCSVSDTNRQEQGCHVSTTTSPLHCDILSACHNCAPRFQCCKNGASTGLPRREAGNAHTFVCMSAATDQLSAMSAVLLTNAYYVYSEAAPEQARAGLSDTQRAAFPDLVGSEPQLDAANTGSDVKATEFSTLGGVLSLIVHTRGQHAFHALTCQIEESTCQRREQTACDYFFMIMSAYVVQTTSLHFQQVKSCLCLHVLLT